MQRIAAAYSHAVMRLDATAAAATYAEDGVLAAFYKPEIVGREAIRSALAITFAPIAFLAQTCGAGIIKIEGDMAHATWTVTELLRFREGDGLACCFGSYDDDLVRTVEGWRFAQRRFLPFFRGTFAAEGRSYDAPDLQALPAIWPPAGLAELR